MALQCPRCRRQYDVTLFQFGNLVQCECGATVDLARGHVVEDEAAEAARPEPRVSPQRAGDDAGATELVLVCHGEVAGGRTTQVVGAEEPSLSRVGRRQALDLARRFLGERLAAIYASDAACCRATAEPIASETGVQVRTTPLLRGAEPERLVAFLRELARRHAGATTLAVTDEAGCRAALRAALGVPRDGRAAFRVDPASVHRIEVGAGGWRVALLNDTCHLASEGRGL
jgi:broad specificity phosphatase PhoE